MLEQAARHPYRRTTLTASLKHQAAWRQPSLAAGNRISAWPTRI